jgi:hypothetical protein
MRERRGRDRCPHHVTHCGGIHACVVAGCPRGLSDQGEQPTDGRRTESTLAQLAAIERELAANLGRLHQIEHEAEVANLAFNVDGSFHRGTRLGKRLNAGKEQLDPRFDELQRAAVELRAAPLASFYRWADVNAMRSAVLRTLIVYGCCWQASILSSRTRGKRWGRSLPATCFFPIRDVGDTLYGSALLSGLSSVAILLFISRGRKVSILAARSDVERLWTDFAQSTVDPMFGDHQADDEIHDRTARRPRGGKSEGDERAWYEILGVSSRATAAKINAAYRAKMMKNHPDKVAELDEEFRELGESRAKLLNRARTEGLQAHA